MLQVPLGQGGAGAGRVARGLALVNRGVIARGDARAVASTAAPHARYGGVPPMSKARSPAATTVPNTNFAAGISRELNLPHSGVGAALELLLGGATVPFVARYRKEATGGLDEVQLRAIGEAQSRLVELEARRATIRDRA